MISIRLVQINEFGLRIGQDHPRAVLTDRQVELVRVMHERGWTYPALAAKFEVSRWTIARICRHERRAQVAQRFKKVEAV